ncbi:AI-2E family transporter [Candidatus Gottesmanbacteria bacterium]|nr:AI-2E family transporter [Candidatus Gottesmanbacteria bacterium]
MAIPAKVEISHKTIIFTLIFLISLWFLYQIREIIFLVFVAFILMSSFKPWADFLEKYRIPRIISVFIIYIFLITLLAWGASNLLPALVTQSIHLGENLPKYLKSTAPFLTIDYQILSQQVTPLGENVLRLTIGIFSNIITLFTLIIISFYLLLERRNLIKYLSNITDENKAKNWVEIVAKIEERLGAWVRGQLILAFTIGIAAYISLSIIGIPYTLSLAILAGILEIVPIIGPIISAIPAVLIALTTSPFLALVTVLSYFVIQQLESHLIVPLVMRKTVGLPPLVTIISLLIGAKIAGIGGALLAIPIVVAGSTFLIEYIKLKEPH